MLNKTRLCFVLYLSRVSSRESCLLWRYVMFTLPLNSFIHQSNRPETPECLRLVFCPSANATSDSEAFACLVTNED